MVAQVAALEPDTAAKMPQPITLVCSSRPGTLFNHGAKPLNMSAVSLERNKISPIHKKSGKAVSVQLVVEPQMVSTMLSPPDLVVKNSMATTATPSKVRPIHSPEARIAIMMRIKKPAM